MYFSVDRIVDGKALLFGDDAKPLEVTLNMLPADIKEGDLVCNNEDGDFVLSPEKTKEKRERVANMLGMLLRTGEDE